MENRFLRVIVLALPVFLFSCGGSGKRLTQERDVVGFHSVDLSGPMRVFIYVEPDRAKPVCTLSGDDNIVSGVDTKVKDGVLHIRFPKGYVLKSPIEVRLTMAELKGIGVSLTGEIEAVVKSPRMDKLGIEVRGKGELTLRGIDAGNVDAKIAGVGNMTVKGRANSLALAISGMGRADFSSLCAESAEVSVNGAGNVTIAAKSKLAVKMTGGGNVNYYGEPAVTPEIKGTGGINRLEDTPPCDIGD